MSIDAESVRKAGALGSNQRDFRRCLSQFATGVNIVTTQVSEVYPYSAYSGVSHASTIPDVRPWRHPVASALAPTES